MPKDALLAVLAAIDAANAADPNSDPDGRPAALVYGERMSEELARRSPTLPSTCGSPPAASTSSAGRSPALTTRTGAPAISGGGLTRPAPTPNGWLA